MRIQNEYQNSVSECYKRRRSFFLPAALKTDPLISLSITLTIVSASQNTPLLLTSLKQEGGLAEIVLTDSIRMNERILLTLPWSFVK